MVKFALLVLCAVLSVSMAQQFRPAERTSTAGRYVADNSGRYNANDGRYRPDDAGRYNPDGSGAYSGNNGRYNPDGAGAYSGGGGQYTGGGGQYTGGGGQYTGQNDKYRGDGSGAGGSGIKSATIGALVGGGFGGQKSSGAGSRTGTKTGNYGNYNGNIAILRQEGHVDEDGYHYLYETENGILGEEQGKLANRGTDEEAMRANGFFTYTGPDNVVYTVRYTADENGFVPQGDHLPVAPPTPEAILRALEYQRAQGTL